MPLGPLAPQVNEYFLGQLVRCAVPASAPFAVNGTPTDPDTIVFKVRTPAGVETTYTYAIGPTVVRDGVGQYHVDVLLNQTGRWWYRWEGTGAVETAAEQMLYVIETAF